MNSVNSIFEVLGFDGEIQLAQTIDFRHKTKTNAIEWEVKNETVQFRTEEIKMSENDFLTII